jgi:hypothetical protein
MPVVAEDTTNYLLDVFVQNLAQSGRGYTGLTYADTGLLLSYHRLNAATAPTITKATATAGSFTSGGFVEVDATKQPGIYQIGVPNAVFAATFVGATLYLNGPLDLFMAPVRFEPPVGSSGGGGFLLT